MRHHAFSPLVATESGRRFRYGWWWHMSSGTSVVFIFFAKLFKPIKALFSRSFRPCSCSSPTICAGWKLLLKIVLISTYFIFSTIWIARIFPIIVVNPSIFEIGFTIFFLIFGYFAVYYSLLYEPKNRTNYCNNNYPHKNSKQKSTQENEVMK